MTSNNPTIKSNLLGIFIFLGLSILGFFMYKGFKTFSDKDRVVTVKGLAEMNMKAVSASMHLDFSFSGDDVHAAIAQTEAKTQKVLAYLNEKGIKKDAIKVDQINILDRQTYYEFRWVNGEQREVKIDRYTATQYMSFEIDDVEDAEDLKGQIEFDLISKDLTSNLRVNYVFPELNSIKPELIAESTKNARVAGEQFANDSQAKLGKIKTASQGQISIVGRYSYYDDNNEAPEQPYLQKARVVSTIVFFLE